VARGKTAIVVLGHGWRDTDGAHRISRRCLRIVREAERLAGSTGAEVVVFTGWSSTGGPSEAEQMRDAWSGPVVDLVVEPTARSTAENAARTLPLLLERAVDRVFVVCAPSHLLRARLLFAGIYRGSGLAVAFRVARQTPTLRSVVWELAAFPFLPVQVVTARAKLARRLG
jgi:uncharacterized SAM-binding protein YcdF (DUF218 family)